MKKTFDAIGIMSGTSLDGVDLAYCVFELQGEKWQYSIEAAGTYPYDEDFKRKLVSAMNTDAEHFCRLHVESGIYFGNIVNEFIAGHRIKPGLIGSHGHTVFHQPEHSMSIQIGSGAHISAITGIETVCDFRMTDAALGGQGAPLVPIGDRFLFSEYDYCLNLGGIANISFDDSGGNRIAFDICPVNMALNMLAMEQNQEFDENGKMASRGDINMDLLAQLNALAYYSLTPPKTLGKEWFDKNLSTLITDRSVPVEARMRTMTEHIAFQISKCMSRAKSKKVLVTGGGAFNKFLVEKIREQSGQEIIVPDARLVKFKEALIFAFLGVLRKAGMINTLSSVTGAIRNSSGGAIFAGN